MHGINDNQLSNALQVSFNGLAAGVPKQRSGKGQYFTCIETHWPFQCFTAEIKQQSKWYTDVKFGFWTTIFYHCIYLDSYSKMVTRNKFIAASSAGHTSKYANDMERKMSRATHLQGGYKLNGTDKR